jgi:hypothetical protein
MTKRVGLHEIKVGDRARTDLGDLTDLMASIEELGLLQPIVITDDHELIAGGRRLEACRKLGMTEVKVTVAERITDVAGLLKAERDENTCRKDMTPSELVTIGRALERLKKPEAEARRREGNARGGRGGEVGLPKKTDLQPETKSEIEAGKTDVVVSKALGIGSASYWRAKSLVQAAETGDEKAAEAVAEMDRTGKITPAYNQWRNRPTAPSGSAPKTPAPPAPPLINSNGRRYPQRSQRKAISEGMAALSGLCAGLASVTDLDESTDAEEVALWQSDLNQALRVLRSLNNTFKEHLNGKR